MATRRIRIKKEAVSVVFEDKVSVGVDRAKDEDTTVIAITNIDGSTEQVNIRSASLFSSMADAIRRAAPSASAFADAVRSTGLASGGPVTGRVSGREINAATIARSVDGGVISQASVVSDSTVTFRQEDAVPPPGNGRPGEILYERNSGETYIHNGQTWVPMGTSRARLTATDTVSMRQQVGQYSFRIFADRDLATRSYRLEVVVYRGGQTHYRAGERVTEEELIGNSRGAGNAIQRALRRIAEQIADSVIYQEISRQIAADASMSRLFEL